MKLAKSWPVPRSPNKRTPPTLDGLAMALDVRGVALMLDKSETAVRHLVERRALPFRKLNGRILFLRSELEEFLLTLPGCTPEEAREHPGNAPWLI